MLADATANTQAAAGPSGEHVVCIIALLCTQMFACAKVAMELTV